MRKSDMPVRVRLFFLFSALVTIVIGATLLRRGWNLRALYLSGEVRAQLTMILNSLRDDHGVPRSFFVIDRLGCDPTGCELFMVEQPNLVTSHTPRKTLNVGWSRTEPMQYIWSYGLTQ